MSQKIQIKRGLNANLGTATLSDGELAFVTDTGKLYAGNGGSKTLINPTPTASDVGLGNVTNESKTTMFSSPTFTGTPISTTPVSTDNSTKIATTAFVKTSLTTYVQNTDTIDGGTF